jgi:hypothetical protein
MSYVLIYPTLPQFPLKASAGGRYLTYQDGTPFLMIGDSPQCMISALSVDDAQTYIADRANRGINCIQVHLMTAQHANYGTVDSITPFTTSGDLSTPREAYFARVDAMLAAAAARGMTVMLTAAECIDGLTLFQGNSEAKCLGFGQYLGARYASTPNLIWNYGNDFQTWDSTPGDLARYIAVCDGIQDYDANHLHTAWLDYHLSASRDSTDWDSRITLDLGYTYYPTYGITLAEYAKSPVKPVFMGEANYEGESIMGYTTTPFVIRKQNYWAMLSGACGTFYCNGPHTYAFSSGWAAGLDTTGVNELAYLKALLGAVSWWSLVPDSAHAVLTVGYGTAITGENGSIDTNDYAAVATLADGSLLLGYLPTNRQVTVAMTFFRGSVTARWFDPTNGSYSTVSGSPFAASGTRNFTPSATNAAGGTDWVLVLTA